MSEETGTAHGTRRGVLAGLAALGLGVVGSTPGRARTPTGRASEPAGPVDEPFARPGELEAFVDDVMADRVGDVTPGATVAIVEGDTPLLTKGYGVADIDTGVPVRADETAFRVGSVGKLVTWTAVMQGVQRGTLDLDADVDTYLDDSAVGIPDTYDEPVTLRHLGTHTAGFGSGLDPDVVASPEELRPLETVLADHRPDRIRPPGAAVGYSNYGAALAGHVVAEAHDTTFEEYVRSEIFEPLGMTHSTFAQPVPEDHPGVSATGHSRDGTTLTAGDEVYINMRPAGSLGATAADMARFMSAHLGDGASGGTRILAPATARTMHGVHHVRHPAVNNWRYGFYEYGAPDANLLAHSGATVYFGSLLVLAPEHDVGIFLNYNSDADERHLTGAVEEIMDEYGLHPEPTPPTSTTDPGRADRIEAVTGEYSSTLLPESGPMQLVDVLARVSVRATEDGRLRTETLDGDTREWIETDPYVFREREGHDVLAFETADGTAERMYVSSAQQGVYEPVPAHERRLVTGGVVGGSLSGFALSVLGWGVAGAWRRWSRSRDGEEALGRWSG